MKRTNALTAFFFGVTVSVSVAACATDPIDEGVSSSESAQTSEDEDCQKPLPDPPSTFNAIAKVPLQIFKIRDDLRGVAPVPGAVVQPNQEMAIYALNPRTGWCQTSALNFEFIECDRSRITINRAPTFAVPGDIQTFMNTTSFQLPDVMIPSVDTQAIAAFGDARTLLDVPIYDIARDGSFVPRSASVPGNVTVGMYAQRGKWIQSSVWLQLVDVGAPPGSPGTRIAAEKCKKKKKNPCDGKPTQEDLAERGFVLPSRAAAKAAVLPNGILQQNPPPSAQCDSVIWGGRPPARSEHSNVYEGSVQTANCRGSISRCFYCKVDDQGRASFPEVWSANPHACRFP